MVNEKREKLYQSNGYRKVKSDRESGIELNDINKRWNSVYTFIKIEQSICYMFGCILEYLFE